MNGWLDSGELTWDGDYRTDPTTAQVQEESGSVLVDGEWQLPFVLGAGPSGLLAEVFTMRSYFYLHPDDRPDQGDRWFSMPDLLLTGSVGTSLSDNQYGYPPWVRIELWLAQEVLPRDPATPPPLPTWDRSRTVHEAQGENRGGASVWGGDVATRFAYPDIWGNVSGLSASEPLTIALWTGIRFYYEGWATGKVDLKLTNPEWSVKTL